MIGMDLFTLTPSTLDGYRFERLLIRVNIALFPSKIKYGFLLRPSTQCGYRSKMTKRACPEDSFKNPRGFHGFGVMSAPLAWMYSLYVSLRRLLYDWQILPVRQSPLFTVSVGGIEAGGVGKTPVVVYLLGILLKHGRKPGLLSRGYGREERDLVLRLPGDPVSPAQHGDEPAMVVAAGLDVPLGICGDRVRGANVLAAGSRSDTLVLDDGFAHRRLSRHVDLVVLRGEAPLGNGRVLPRGTLREPARGLKRAHVLWFHSKTGRFNEEEIARALALNVDASQVRSIPHGLSVSTLRRSPMELSGKSVVAVAGIARPEDFGDTLVNLGATIVHFKAYPDHHRYTRRDRVAIGESLLKHQADYVVTTAKDYVKLQPLWGSDDLVQVNYGLKVIQGEPELFRQLVLEH